MTVKLAAVKAGRSVAQNEANFKRLQVADDTFQRKIEIGTASGGALTLYLGTSAGGRATHVRLGGQNDVYIASDLAPFDVNADAAPGSTPTTWKLPQADVTSLTLKNAQGQFSLREERAGAVDDAGPGAGRAVQREQLHAPCSPTPAASA